MQGTKIARGGKRKPQSMFKTRRLDNIGSAVIISEQGSLKLKILSNSTESLRQFCYFRNV